MKKYSFVAIAALLLTSCSGSKKVAPSATEFEGAQLANLIELVDEEGTLALRKNENSQTLSLKAKVQLTAETAYLQEVDLDDIDFSYEPLSVTLQNPEEEVTVLELVEEDYVALAMLLQGKAGDVAELTFSATFEDAKESKKWLKTTTSFVPCFAGEVYPIEYNMEGSIGKYPVCITLVEDGDGMIRGAYYYKKSGSGALLYLVGERNGQYIVLYEYDDRYRQTGYFEGSLSYHEFAGMFMALANGRTFDFYMKPTTDYKSLKFNDQTFKNFVYNRMFAPEIEEEEVEIDEEEIPDSLPDFEVLLDDYEVLINRYIALLKKSQDGDFSALEDAAIIMEKATEIDEKLTEYMEDLSPEEYQRMCDIAARLLHASESMQEEL